ncbi:MAG: ABC transporter permease [Candidatus Polarisedimenticolia bacterium]
MRNLLAIAGREIRSYFTSPLAYVIVGVFLALTGYIFWISLVRYSDLCLRFGNNPYFLNQLNVNDLVIRPLFGSVGVIFLLMMPAISMRLLSEERKTGTAELLFTCPITTTQVVVGKFLGAAFLLLVMMGVTLTYPLVIMTKAQPDLMPTLAGYLGVLLMGLSILAVGVLISAMTENQIVAAVGAFGVNLLLWAIAWAADAARSVTLASLMNRLTLGLWEKLKLGLGGPTLGDLLSRLSVTEHFQDFRKGLVDTEHLVFYASAIFLALFLTQRVVESRTWR